MTNFRPHHLFLHPWDNFQVMGMFIAEGVLDPRRPAPDAGHSTQILGQYQLAAFPREHLLNDSVCNRFWL
jgi:hypothetical protein